MARPFVLLVAAHAAALQLPAGITTARQSVAWSYEPADTPPLHYLPLQDLPAARAAVNPSCAKRGISAGPLAAPFDALASDIEGAIDALGGSDYARVAAGLLLLGGGGADECHALVTPLSWPKPTSFGGPPVIDSEAVAEATYAHALVHRREAWHLGETFECESVSGWHTSKFWYKRLERYELGAKLQERARGLAFKATGDQHKTRNQVNLAWCEKNLWKAWRPGKLDDALNDALVMARQTPNRGSRASSKAAFADFAAQLATIELEVLLDHCLERALVGDSAVAEADAPPQAHEVQMLQNTSAPASVLAGSTAGRSY